MGNTIYICAYFVYHSHQQRFVSHVSTAKQPGHSCYSSHFGPAGGEASPRDADRIMSGYWGVVAIWVTHPLCPFRVPLTVICSVIFTRFSGAFYRDGFGFSGARKILNPHRIWAQRKRKFEPGCKKYKGVRSQQRILGKAY